MDKLSLLIVENNRFLRKSLKRILKEKIRTIDIFESESIHEVRFEIDDTPPDVILTNINIAGEDGLKFAKNLIDHYPDVRVVVASGWDILEYHQLSRNISSRISILTNDFTIKKMVSILKIAETQKREESKKKISLFKKSKVCLANDMGLGAKDRFVLA